jgi:hypothetical protein
VTAGCPERKNKRDMDISRRLIGVSAVLSANQKVTDIDIGGLIRRLLLFDKYIMVSIRLQEFPLLVRYLGYQGLQDLLSAKLIEIRCECLQLSQTAQSGMFGDPVLPLFTYRFHWIDSHDRRKYIHDCLQCVHSTPDLQHKQVSKLKRAIVNAIRQLPEDARSQLFPAFENELLHSQSLVQIAVGMVIRARLGLTDVPFSLAMHQEASDTFRVETDLHDRMKLSDLEAHKFIEEGIMGIAGLSQSIGEMKAYSAISGFRDEELPLFRHKLDFLADAVSSQTREHNFQRVIDVAGLPHFPTDEGRINVERLLRIRESSEAREFRDWLGGIGQANEVEIRDRVEGLRAKAGAKVSSGAGKAMRFLVTTALGAVPHAIVPAFAVGVFDQFVLDKLLPRSGITAFVNELYPSIFESKK